MHKIMVEVAKANARGYPGADGRLIEGYVSHVVDPQNTTPVGIPDQTIGAQPTGLVNSIMSFDVTVDGTLTDNANRFGFVVSPTLGDSSSPDTFKVALVQNFASWPSDFSLDSSFVRNSGTVPLTVDKAFKTLVMPDVSYFEAYGTSGAAPGGLLESPLGGGGPPDGPTANGTWTITPTTADNENPTLGAAAFFGFPSVGTGQLTLPPGQWALYLNSRFVAANGAVSAHVLTPANPALCKISTQQSTAVLNTFTTSSENIISVYQEPATINITWSNQPTQIFDTDVTLLSSWARPDKLATPASGYPLDGGMVRNYVPVAMSVLATFTSPSLTVAGNIAACTVPANTCATNVFTNMPSIDVGNPLYYEKLRDFPMAYSGALKDGAYAIWMPSGYGDMTLRTPTEQRDRDWPCIIMSGRATGNTAQNLSVLRVIVCTTYQFTSDVKIIPMTMRDGSTAAREEAIRLLMTFPRASANGVHFENIKRLFRRIADGVNSAVKFYQDNRKVIDPALALGASFL